MKTRFRKLAVILFVTFMVIFGMGDMCTDCNGRSPCIPDVTEQI